MVLGLQNTNIYKTQTSAKKIKDLSYFYFISPCIHYDFFYCLQSDRVRRRHQGCFLQARVRHQSIQILPVSSLYHYLFKYLGIYYSLEFL